MDVNYEKKLMTDILSLKDDWYRLVMYLFPWGQKGTPLEKHNGPRRWQKDELDCISAHMAENKERLRKGDPILMYQSATASGRGIGKSALVSWLIHGFMSTRFGGSVVVAANSESQLKNVTWGELGKWGSLSLNRHWFERAAMSLKPTKWLAEGLIRDLGIDETLYAAHAKLWSEENTASFAGMHNGNGEMVIFDEASGIPKAIWDVTDGLFTEPILDRFWFAFSNPRQNQGAFYDCFHANKEFWKTRNIDSRTVEGVDVTKLNQIVRANGEDSDTAKVEVMGQFPGTSDKQFISRELVDIACAREAELMVDMTQPLVMGVDPARFGSDDSVVCFRQGRVNKSPFVPPPRRFHGLDNMQLADAVADMINRYDPDAVCIDAGNGTGVIDRLKQRGYRNIHEVWFGGKPDDKIRYANRRAELWDKIKEWLLGAALDDSVELRTELTSPEFYYQGNSDKILLESKEDMKKRGVPSPDYADALACTFAVNLVRRDMRTSRVGRAPKFAKTSYDIFGRK